LTGLAHLRRFAVARSLFGPTTLGTALDRFGFVQADPIRAPARAQDLTLRHRVSGYRAGDLEHRFARLGIEEDFFVNYGFVTADVQALMHPRGPAEPRSRRAAAVLAFVRARGEVHPRDVDRHFASGRVTNYWGGSSNATTHLLQQMNYQGWLRVARRERGIRIYAVRPQTPAAVGAEARRIRVDRLIDVVVRKYAPLPAPSLSSLVRRLLRCGAPQLKGETGSGLKRAKARLARTRIGGVDWYWPADERPDDAEIRDEVRLLAPFDPIVWDRRRFELLWGWAYRFEAYTPAPKRQRGYYALPLLWRDRVIGWGNLAVDDGTLVADVSYLAGRKPRDRQVGRELDAELDRIRAFLFR
jgi:hypothetical protein